MAEKYDSKKENLAHKVGDKIERLGEKIGPNKVGNAVRNMGDKIEHSRDNKKK